MVPEGHDGGAVWATPAIDRETRRLCVGTGNAYHDAGRADDRRDRRAGRAQRPDPEPLPGDPGRQLERHRGRRRRARTTTSARRRKLFTGPNGQKLVGEGQKSGIYWALDRDTMKPAWHAQTGPGSLVGGIIGSTATDGQRIYGPDTVAGENWALDTSGLARWLSADGGPLTSTRRGGERRGLDDRHVRLPDRARRGDGRACSRASRSARRPGAACRWRAARCSPRSARRAAPATSRPTAYAAATGATPGARRYDGDEPRARPNAEEGRQEAGKKQEAHTREGRAAAARPPPRRRGKAAAASSDGTTKKGHEHGGRRTATSHPAPAARRPPEQQRRARARSRAAAARRRPSASAATATCRSRPARRRRCKLYYGPYTVAPRPGPQPRRPRAADAATAS